MGCPVKESPKKKGPNCCNYKFRPEGCRTLDPCQWRGYLVNKSLWANLLATLVIVIAVVAVVVSKSETDEVNAWGRLPGSLDNWIVVVLLGGIPLLLAAYATFLSGSCSGTMWNAGVGALFLLIGVLFFVGVLAAYHYKNFSVAFWAFLVALVFGVLHLAACFRNHQTAWVITLPLVAVLIYVTYESYNLMRDSAYCLDPCAPVYGLPEPVVNAA